MRDNGADAPCTADRRELGVGVGRRDRLVGTTLGGVEVADQSRRIGCAGEDRRPLRVGGERRVLGELHDPLPDLAQVTPRDNPVHRNRDRHPGVDRREVAGGSQVVHLLPKPPVGGGLGGRVHRLTDVLGNDAAPLDELRV